MTEHTLPPEFTANVVVPPEETMVADSKSEGSVSDILRHVGREIVSYLKEAGYRVICIDQKTTHGRDAEGLSGNRPVIELARYLKYADFSRGCRAAGPGSPGPWARQS